MAQVSRSTFTTNLGTLINDNTTNDITPADVRSVFTDLEDSAAWFDEAVFRAETSNLTAGYTTTPFSLGTATTGTVTPAFANGNLQTLTNGGAFTLAAPTTGSGTMLIELANTAGAGTVTLSGFASVTGATLTGTNGHLFLLSIARFGSRSWLSIVAASGNA